MTLERQTSAPNPAEQPLRFGIFELDERTGELRRSGVLIHLQPMPTKLLALLVRRAGQLVTREEIQRELWNGETYVDFERSINICVMQIRAALGDEAETPRFVETLPRRGYRFVAEAARAQTPGKEAAAQPAATGESRSLVMWTLRLGLIGLILLLYAASRIPLPTVQAPGDARVMLAVLPFENLSGKPELDYVADGMTEELIAQLGRIAPEKLGVIARTSAMRYRGARESVAKIGGTLNVEYVIEGSVKVEGSRAWVTAQLIRVSDETHLWAQTFERDSASIFDTQQAVAGLVATQLKDRLLPAQIRAAAAASQPHNAAAVDAYLQGRYLFYRGSRDDLAQAVQHFERAVAADANFVEAHATLADALQFATMIGRFTPEETADRARSAAERAVALDASSSEAHAARGLVAMWFDWNPQAAVAHFEKSLALNPSNAEAHHDYAFALVAVGGRDDEAVRAIHAAQALDPVSPRANMDLGWMYLSVRRYDDAIRHCTRMVEVEPRVYEAAQSCLETAYLAKGDARAAADAALRQLERNPSQAGRVPELKKLAPQAALRELWQFRLDQRLTGPSRRKAYRAAELYLKLGDKEKALANLEQAVAEREMLLVSLHRTAEFDPLRDEPRFKAVLARIKPQP